MEALNKDFVYTTDYIATLPEGERAELIDGRIYYRVSPTRTHQQTLGYLYNQIYNYIKYWIVDTAKECGIVYHFERGTMEEYSFGEDVPSGIYAGFGIALQKII